MPTYCYECFSCQKKIDVVKLISEIDRIEICPDCGLDMSRDRETEMKSSHTQKQMLEHFDIGLGMVVKDRSHWIKHLDKNGITPYRRNESLLDGR